MEGDRSETMSHWKGLEEVSSSSTSLRPLAPRCLLSHASTPKRDFHLQEDGDSSFQAKSTCLAPYTCLPREQSPQTSPASVEQYQVYIKPYFYETLSSLCFPSIEGGSEGFLSSSDSPASLHVLDRNNPILPVKVKD